MKIISHYNTPNSMLVVINNDYYLQKKDSGGVAKEPPFLSTGRCSVSS